MKIFALENLQVDNKNKIIQDDEIRMFQLEVELCDIKSKVAKMESNNKRLLKEIEKSKKTIVSLNE